MDSTEDLSARVLLKHILNVETPRTPLTRSVAAKSSAPRRSGRLNKHDSGALTPQAMLRRSLKHKIRESISSKTLPSKRPTSTLLRQTPGPASMLFDDGDTPRQIFKNILLTEPVKSPVVNEPVESEEPSPGSSLQSTHPCELSGLELSDLTVDDVETTVKRLNRKRPHRSLNVTAFEKRLKGANDLAEEEYLEEDHSSLSLSSSTSLSLKTPFTDAQTERKALQRKGLNRRKVSEEDFGAAVDKRETSNKHGISVSAPDQVLSETTYSEGITLGLSKISELDITTDIVNFKTALYSQTDGVMSNYSILATQDKPTVMASQIQRDLKEQLDVNEQHYSFPTEENSMTEVRSQSISTYIDSAVTDAAAPCQPEQEKSVANRTFDVADPDGSKNIENVDAHNSEKANSQTEDNSGLVRSSESGDQADIQIQGEDVQQPKKKDPATEQQSHLEAPLSLTLEKEETDAQVNDEGESVHEEEVQEEEVENEEEEVKNENKNEVEEEDEAELVENEKEEIEEENGKERIEEEEDQEEDEEEDETAEKRGDEVEEEEDDEQWLEKTEADTKGAEDAVGDSEGDKVQEADSQEDEDEDEDEAEEVENEKKEMEEEDNGKESIDEEEEETAERRGDDVEEEGDEQWLEQTEADMKGAEDAVGDSEGDKVQEADSQEDEDENSEHITRRAMCAEDELIMLLQNTDADLPDTKPERYDDMAEPSIQDGSEGEAYPNENKENTFQESGPPEDIKQVEEEEEEEEESVEEEEEEEDDFPGKTPAFVKQKRYFFHSDAQASPLAPKNIQPSDAGPGPKSKQKVQRKPRSPKSDPALPKSYLMKVLKHFAKTKVSADVYPVLKDVMDKFLDRLAKDLEAYALHARRSTIGVADCELLLRRQGHVNDKVPVEVLIEKYLRMDQRKLLIPIATSGNVVFPKKR